MNGQGTFFQSKGHLKMLKSGDKVNETKKLSKIKDVWGSLQGGMKEEKLQPGEDTCFMKSQEIIFRFIHAVPASTTHLWFEHNQVHLVCYMHRQ